MGALAFRITRLTLSDFRNYEALRLEPATGLTALAGPNGAGKTNLLEAISLLMPGRGLRSAEYAELGRQGGDGAWAVSARLEGPTGDVQLGTAWSRSETEGTAAPRAVLVDGHLQKSSGALAEHLRLVWLTPAQDRLFAGSTSERRRYLDRTVALFDLSHSTRVNRFEKLMRERNALLERASGDNAWLTTLEAQMAEEAVAIAAARLHAVEQLNPVLGEAHRLEPFPWSRMTLLGEIEDHVAREPALQAEAHYRDQLKTNRSADRGAGRTLKGPHRSDFTLTHGPKQIPAAQGSTGEQKALLIGLLLAQAEAISQSAGARPLLLLDEITAHLDKARREALFSILKGLGIQAFMTGTDAHVFAGLGAEAVVYQVENGHLSESLF
jgi:DNA replication and repair protein RecF